MRHLWRRPRCAFAAGLLALAAGSAGGANWELAPRIEVGGQYDDNYRLTDVEGSEIEVTGALLDARLALRTLDPRSTFEITPRVRSTLFPGDEEEESDDYFLEALWSREAPRSRTELRAGYADESVVTSELLRADFPDIDLGETVGGDGGRVSVRNRRELLWLNPSARFDWTERRRLLLDARYLDASYDRTFFEQVGYRDLRGSAGLAVDVSPRTALELRVLASAYEPDAGQDETFRYGLEGQWSVQRSEVSQVYLRLGVSQTEADVRRNGILQSLSETGVTGGLGARWSLPAAELFVDALRSIEPSSAGVMVDRDELRIRLRRAFSPRFATQLALRGIRTEGAVEDVAAIRDREYASATLGLEWRIRRPLALLARYDFTWQEFEGEPADATSNGAGISLVYEPRRRE